MANIINIPGGSLISGMGGWVQKNTVGLSPEIASAGRLDVSRWIGKRIYRTVEATHSGCYGRIARRRTALDFMAFFEVVFDATNPPEWMLEANASVSVQLRFGDAIAYVGTGIEQKRYVAPSVLLADVQTTDDSTGTDVVRQVCQIQSNSGVFLLPEEQSDYTQYLAYLASRSWVGA